MQRDNKIKDINEYKKQKKNTHRKRRNKKLKKVLIRTSIFVSIFSTLIINICGYAVVSELKYDIHYLKNDLRKEEIRLGEVQTKLNETTSIKVIEKKAKEELNMNYPTKDQIRYIEVDE